jgi:hypothetical protein
MTRRRCLYIQKHILNGFLIAIENEKIENEHG